MDKRSVDVAIIGSGTAGMTAYRAACAHGARTLMIEQGPYGTTCARVGCMPSKLLLAAADAAHAARTAPAFGVQPGPVAIDGAAVMARVRAERDRFVGFVLDAIEAIPAGDRLQGRARLVGPNTLRIDEHTEVEAARIVIATGSSPLRLEQLAGADNMVATSDDLFDWERLPESVAVIGTGVTGLELGQALHRLGVRVRLIARGGSIAQISDPQVRRTASTILTGELDIAFQTDITGAAVDGDGVMLHTRDAGGQESRTRFDRILAATGRRANVHGLGLEHAGIELDEHGVPVFDRRTMQCGSSHVFIAGDASDEVPLLHEAADQGKIAGDNAGRFPDVRPGLRRTPLGVAFCEPNIATVGKSWRALCAGGQRKFAVGSVSFDDQGRSRVMLHNRGLLRVYGEYGSRLFLGAEMIAPRGEHLAHLLAWACQMRMTVDQMLEMPFYHPVIEEGVRTALRDLARQLSRGEGGTHASDSEPGT